MGLLHLYFALLEMYSQKLNFNICHLKLILVRLEANTMLLDELEEFAEIVNMFLYRVEEIKKIINTISIEIIWQF